MTFLLKSEQYYNINHDVIGRVNAEILFYANIIPLMLCPMFGYIYDIFGRRVPIYTAIFGSIICMSLMPQVAPNLNLLILIRTIQSTFCVLIISNPLIADYIKKDSRGKAIALVATGMGLGEAFSMTVLFGLSAALPLNQSYQFASAVLITMSLASLFMLREPELKMNKRKEIVRRDADGITERSTCSNPSS